MIAFLRGAWWTLWHPAQAMLVAVFAIACFVAPELALLWLLIGWSLREQDRRLRAQLRVVQGIGFTMRDLLPGEERAR